MKIGLYYNSFDFSEYDAATISKTFDMSQSWWVNWSDPWYDAYVAKINQTHALNPNYKFLLYRNIASIYNYWLDEWNYAQSQGWLLKDVNGNYVTEAWAANYMVDITNPAYQQWLAVKIQSWLTQHPEFDGIFADNSLRYSAQEFEASGTARPINPRTGTYFTDTEILDGCAGVLNAIINAIGTTKLLMPNGIYTGAIWWNTWFGGDNYRYILSKVPRLNCLTSEGTFILGGGQWYGELEWKNSVDFVAWVQDNFLNGHPDRMFGGEAETYALPPNATAEQVMTFGYCSMLLATKYSSQQNNIGFGVNNENMPSLNLLQFLQKLRSLDMANPLGDYYKISATSVYGRDFTNGKILVNPTATPYTITLDRTYTTFNGATVSGVLTVLPHTGEILLSALPISYNLSVSSLPISNVPITVDGYQYNTPTAQLSLPSGVHTVITPQNVIVGANVYNFVQWEDGSTNLTRTINLTSDATITCTYQSPATLIINASGGGTTTPVAGRYNYDEGSIVQITAIPDANYRFSHWELDGTTRTENPVTVVMDMDYSLRAVFEELPPPPPEKRYLTIVAINGQTNPAPATYTLDQNSTITVTATANQGYIFEHWLLDNVIAGMDPPITVTMDTNHTLVAVCEAVSPTPTLWTWPFLTWLRNLIKKRQG